jgi:hypothetical protein
VPIDSSQNDLLFQLVSSGRASVSMWQFCFAVLGKASLGKDEHIFGKRLQY